MKRIINGKRYDTEKAQAIASYESDCPKSDFGWYYERLFRTPRGKWFLAGEGHARSPYCSRFSDGWGPGSDIIPLSPEEAREWLEKHNEIDLIEQHFSDKIEDA